MDRTIIAHDLFKQGYNCAQAVVLAFADVLPLEFKQLEAVSSAFGGGFAKTRNVCGAVSGIGMVLGLMSEMSADATKTKLDVYSNVRQCTDEFMKLNGTLLCGELLRNLTNITSDYVPSERTKEYYAERPCVKFVMEAVELIENHPLCKKYLASK